MASNRKTYILALSALVGTTIGAGIFGIPYVYSKSGILIGLLWAVIIGFVLTIANLLHGEFSLRSPDNLRFVGIARRYLGQRLGNAAGILILIGNFGSILAYTILGGSFLAIILSSFLPSISVATCTVLYVVVVGLVLSRSMKFLNKVDLPLVVLLVVTLAGLMLLAAPKIAIVNFAEINLNHFFLPYGVTLFALSSMTAMPAIEEILVRHKHYMRTVIIYSGLIATLLTAAFGVVIAGVTGAGTSDEAIRGLSPYLGHSIIILGALVGFLAVITSHLIVADQQKQILEHDYKVPKIVAWLLAGFLSYVFLLFAKVSFIEVIGFTGSIIGGITGITVGMIALKSGKPGERKPEFTLKHKKFWAFLVMIFFALGIAYEFIYKIFS